MRTPRRASSTPVVEGQCRHRSMLYGRARTGCDAHAIETRGAGIRNLTIPPGGSFGHQVGIDPGRNIPGGASRLRRGQTARA